MNGPLKPLFNTAKTIFTVDICIRHHDQVLMLQRSVTKKAFPGWLTFPGGHIDEGEDPLTAVIRETKEETGLSLSHKELQLKFVAMHHHIDRNEQYVVFGFLAKIETKPTSLMANDEGTLRWINHKDLIQMDTLFPPVKYYLDHVLHKKGILYNNSLWEHAKLTKVLSELVDNNS